MRKPREAYLYTAVENKPVNASGTADSDRTLAYRNGQHNKAGYKRRLSVFAASYAVGIIIGVLFPFGDPETAEYMFLFIRTRLTNLAVSTAATFTLAEHLHSSFFLLLTILFLRYSAFGAPILIALVGVKGFTRTQEMLCVFTQLCDLRLPEYLSGCLLYDFGCTLILLPAALEAFEYSRTMFLCFFRKKRFPEGNSFSLERPLGTFVGILFWCLLVYAVSRLFPVSAL